MRTRSIKIIACLISCIVLSPISIALADPTIINNNYSNPNQPDPRVPPPGTYITKNADGSGSQTYTTGQTQPYNVDNSNNNNSTNNPPIQPYIFPQVPVPGPRR